MLSSSSLGTFFFALLGYWISFYIFFLLMRSINITFLLLGLLLFHINVEALRVYDLNAAFDRPVSLEKIAREVNRKGSWIASHENGKLISNISVQNAKKLMGVLDRQMNDFSPEPRKFSESEKEEVIPESFDSAKHWPHCKSIDEIRDQSSCGSCWAIAAAESITDRYCTVLNQPDTRISTANLLSCCFVCGLGCEGGFPPVAWMWWVWVGLTSESCQPYPFPSCSHHAISDKYPECPSEIYPTPSCNITCNDQQEQFELLKGETSYSLSGEEDFQRELMKNGPFEITLTVYEDFLTYKSGVYSHVTGEALGGHAVKLVGWGIQDGIPYWKIANSWNDDWGDKGFFLIKRGSNECGIEENGVAGIPQ